MVPWFVRGSGTSGIDGFMDEHPRLEQEQFLYSHSEYFSTAHMEHCWMPFLDRPVASGAARVQSQYGTPRLRAATPWGFYAMILLVTTTIGVLVDHHARPLFIREINGVERVARPEWTGAKDFEISNVGDPRWAFTHRLSGSYKLLGRHLVIEVGQGEIRRNTHLPRLPGLSTPMWVDDITLAVCFSQAAGFDFFPKVPSTKSIIPVEASFWLVPTKTISRSVLALDLEKAHDPTQLWLCSQVRSGGGAMPAHAIGRTQLE